MAEQGSAPQTEEVERNAQTVKAGTGDLRKVQGYGLNVSGWGQESQGKAGTGLGKGHKESQEGIHSINT